MLRRLVVASRASWSPGGARTGRSGRCSCGMLRVGRALIQNRRHSPKHTFCVICSTLWRSSPASRSPRSLPGPPNTTSPGEPSNADRHVSLPRPPTMRSRPGPPRTSSRPTPPKTLSLPAWPSWSKSDPPPPRTTSSPGPAAVRSWPGPPMILSPPRPAITKSSPRPAKITSSPPSARISSSPSRAHMTSACAVPRSRSSLLVPVIVQAGRGRAAAWMGVTAANPAASTATPITRVGNLRGRVCIRGLLFL